MVKLNDMWVVETSLDLDFIFELLNVAMSEHFLLVNDLNGHLLLEDLVVS